MFKDEIIPCLRPCTRPRVAFRLEGGTDIAGGIAEQLRHVTTRNTACVPAGYKHLPNAYTVPYGTKLTCLSRSILAMVPGLVAYCASASGISYAWVTVSRLPALSGRSTPCSIVYCAVWRCSADGYSGYLPIMLHCASPTRRAPLRLLLPLHSRHYASGGALG